ncbi:unnamed protein product, partial [Polarella glacialis]
NLRRRRMVDLDGSDALEAGSPAAEGVAHMTRSLCGAVERLAEDLYGSECHFLHELIQNAEDAHRRGQTTGLPKPGGGDAGGTLRLSLSPATPAFPAYFLSESDEAGMNAVDVEALCDISASSKRRGGANSALGHKGIGFKSVFVVSNCPHILSGDFVFKFDTAGPLGKLGYITPTWLTNDELDSLPNAALAAWRSGKTVLLLPLQQDALLKPIAKEMRELCGNSRATLLFLKGLRQLELLPTPGELWQISARTMPQTSSTLTSSSTTAVVLIEGAGAEAANQAGAHSYALHHHRVLLSDRSGAAEPRIPQDVNLILAFSLLALPSPAAAEAVVAARMGDAMQFAMAGSMAGQTLDLAVNVAGKLSEEAFGPELLFCGLPVCCVGFGFAVHCSSWDLVASRSDLHRGSLVNAAARDSIAAAFLGACASHEAIAAHALRYVGLPPADAFWQAARDGILAGLQGVACVPTALGHREPAQVFLCGSSGQGNAAFQRLAQLLPAELLLESCGRAFLVGEADASRSRLLRKLGAVDFAAKHLCKALANVDGAWPGGWVSHLWSSTQQASAAGVISVVYAGIGAGVLGIGTGSAPNYEQTASVKEALQVGTLSIFPLARTGSGVCGRLVDGPIFAGFVKDLPQAWQQALVEGGVARILHPALHHSLCPAAFAFLEGVGVAPCSLQALARCVVLWHLELPARLSNAAADWSRDPGFRRALWAGLAVLRELWLQVSAAPTGGPEGALCDLGVPGVTNFRQLRAVLWLPSQGGGPLRQAAQLTCWSYLGCTGGELGIELVARVAEFLGIPAGAEAAALPAQASMEPCPHEFMDDSLRWEAFLVGALGAWLPKPMSPGIAGGGRMPPELALRVGRALDAPGPGAVSAAEPTDSPTGWLWARLLDRATPAALVAYVERLLAGGWRPVDNLWLAECPVRSLSLAAGRGSRPLRLCDLFLRHIFEPLAGAGLVGRYFDCATLTSADPRPGSQPECAEEGSSAAILRHPSSKEAMPAAVVAHRCLQRLGLCCEANVEGLIRALKVLPFSLPGQGQPDLATHARFYAALMRRLALENTSTFGPKDLPQLRGLVFVPGQESYLPAASCAWPRTGDQSEALLLRCAGLVDLSLIYRGVAADVSDARLEQYFVEHLELSRGPKGAQETYDALDRLVAAADEYGQRLRAGEAEDSISLSLSPLATPASGQELLEGAWPTLLAIYRGLAALPPEERQDALLAHCVVVVVPLRCPEGGPPEVSSLVKVAAHHDGAIFRRLTPFEAYWDVSPGLALSPAAEWALSNFFPEELRGLFMDLGVAETLDRDALAQRLQDQQRQSSRGNSNRRPPSRTAGLDLGRGALVNRSGLTVADLLGAAGAALDALGPFRLDGGNDPFRAAASLLASLQAGAPASSLGHMQSAGSNPGSSQPAGIEQPATVARVLRLRPTPARRLVHSGVEAFAMPARRENGSESVAAVALLAAESELARLQLLRSQGAIAPFARLLVKIATEVFKLPLGGSVAITFEPGLPSVEDCGHVSSGPLLFSWAAYVRGPQNPIFWFAEFCHALAHQAVGCGHLGTAHVLAMQALLSSHLPAFVRAFGEPEDGSLDV